MLDKHILPAHVAYSPTSIMVLLTLLHNTQEHSYGLMADVDLIGDLLVHRPGPNKRGITACITTLAPKLSEIN